jgi:predicted enzyme related to lactoylglutathione lyase
MSLYCIELRTDQWENMLAWYRTALELRVLVRVPEDGYALLAAGETRLALIHRESIEAPSARWSLAFEVESLEVAAARVQAAGSSILEPPPNVEGFRDLLTEDPDGNRIRLFTWPTTSER